ncbi:hypothetical protein ACQKM2_15880 [Streptomyces sp. NPDC004126]|uniref:hypothetical protein n=1 Tax=Streptomyces sp. NPDC004126 TaxID=3390695 RepID=UPI003D03ED26
MAGPSPRQAPEDAGETNRHAGHADTVRELIDGKAGTRKDDSNMGGGDESWYQDHRNRLEASAKEAGARHGSR